MPRIISAVATTTYRPAVRRNPSIAGTIANQSTMLPAL